MLRFRFICDIHSPFALRRSEFFSSNCNNAVYPWMRADSFDWSEDSHVILPN